METTIDEEGNDSLDNCAKPEKADMFCITLTAATPRLALNRSSEV